jgi:hypothetical protein
VGDRGVVDIDSVILAEVGDDPIRQVKAVFDISDEC